MWLIRAAVPVVAVGLLSISGCSSTEPPVAPSELLGEGLEFADSILPDDLSNSVQDIGMLFDAKERFTGGDWGSSQYIVIAACTDTTDVRRAGAVQLGVVSRGAMSDAEVAKARAGAYRDDIGCTKGFFR